MTLKDKFFSIFQRDFLLLISTLVTGVVIARKLGPEMMGVWAILTMITGYAEAFGRTQFDTASVYFIGKLKSHLGEVTVILNTVAIMSVSVILLLFVLLFENIYILVFDKVNFNVRYLLSISFLIIPLRFFYINYSYLLIAQQNIKSYNVQVITQVLVSSLSTLILLLIFETGVVGALIGNIFGLIVSIIYGIKKNHESLKILGFSTRLISIRFFNNRLALDMAKYSAYQYLNSLISYFQANITSLISALFLLPSQVAFYSLGKSISEISTRMVPTAINTVLFPQVSRSIDGDVELVNRSFRVTFFLLFTSSAVLVIIIRPLIIFLYGDAFLQSVLPFLIIIPGVVLSQSASVIRSYFAGVGRPDLLPKISLVPLVVQIILATYLVSEYGLVGAAISFSSSSIILSLITIIIYLKFSNTKLFSLLLKSQDLKLIFTFIWLKMNIIFFLFSKNTDK